MSTSTSVIYTLSLHDALPLYSLMALGFPLAHRCYINLPIVLQFKTSKSTNLSFYTENPNFFLYFCIRLPKLVSWRRRKSFLFRKKSNHFYQVQMFQKLLVNFRKECKRVERKSECLCLDLE